MLEKLKFINYEKQIIMEDKNLSLAKKLNMQVGSVLNATTLEGFERAYLIAEAASQLKAMLTPEYMKPIMALQGNRLGFKTDQDNKSGYPEATVKNCLIEAVLTGVQPFGNQFNIIASNCYITKEGFGYLLKNFQGLSYDITPELPRINSEKTSAAIDMNVNWSINGIKKEKVLHIPVKMNSYMGTDAVIGKATRKARAWLYNTITGSEISDGDITDVEGAKTINITANEQTPEEKENERIIEFIKKAKTKKELEEAAPHIKTPEQTELFNQKLGEVK